ncbi:hypothetical protein BC833DRAFT_626438 [Globomyces pollinis-pini]|nr:hypothetical protein BC833DRAFT_626438 [Globomyces pollinis-pini]KAJ2992310.1 hypothetical protein HDV02_003152 [Globomyces sp. JEL0801]
MFTNYDSKVEESEKVCYDEKLGTYVVNPEILSSIKGLYYYPDFVNDSEQNDIVDLIDSNPWHHVIRRRQQFYGDIYYHTKCDSTDLQPKDKIVNLPMEKFKWLLQRCIDNNHFGADPNYHPDQVLVNEYLKSAGISSHFEDVNAFGPVIVTISLVKPIWITLKKPYHHINSCQEIVKLCRILLQPKSCFIMSEEVRYEWRHGITKKIKIPVGLNEDDIVVRDESYRRLSLTIRKLLDGRKRVEKSDTEWVDVENMDHLKGEICTHCK